MTTPFDLATVSTPAGPVAALRVGGEVFLLPVLDPALAGVGVRDLLQRWDSAFDELGDLAAHVAGLPAEHRPDPVADPVFCAPVLYPDNLLAVGANYAGHLRAMGLSTEKWSPMPYFSRTVRNTLVGCGPTVRIPAGTQQFDWECELTVVLGRRLRDATREEARAAIAGYTVGLDMTCRDLITVDNELSVDLGRGKSQDTMCPVGPWITPAAFVGDVDDLQVRLHVGDELMMDASTSEMIFTVDEALADVSRSITLQPGDLLLTGSPDGSAGQHGDRWLVPGDTITASIGPIGPLRVTTTAA